MSEEISVEDVYQNLTVSSAVCLRLALILTLRCNTRNIVEILLAVHHIFEGSFEKIFISKKTESHHNKQRYANFCRISFSFATRNSRENLLLTV